MTQPSVSQKMSTFILIWIGQVISAFGSGLTSFALGVWVYQQTGSTTRFAMILFAAHAPAILISPLVGTLVDRWNRRWVMILSDTGAAVTTLAIVLLIWGDLLHIWHLYLLVGVSSVFRSFQMPAFSASTTLLVAKSQYGRASGMTQMGYAVAQMLAPMTGGLLLVGIGLSGVITIDFATFLFAVVILLLVRIPQPPTTAAGVAGKGTLKSETAYGWRYLKERKGLMGLLIMFAAFNFAVGVLQVLLTPLILSFSDAPTLGTVLSVGATGLVLGGLAMTIWGGPQRRMTAIYLIPVFQGLILFLGGFRESAVLIGIAAFVYMFGTPIINGCSQAIWQSKVAPDVQGRVFAIRRMIVLCAVPLAQLISGPLADYVFEPLLAVGGPLAGTVGQIIGVGPGRGTGLLFITLGCFMLLVALLGYRYSPLRNVETELPDAIESEATPASSEDA